MRATVSASGRSVQAYAAVGPTRATIALVNEDATPVDVTIALGSFSATGAAALYTGNGNAITRQADAPVQGNQATVRLPASSFAMVVASGVAPALPDFAVPAPADGGVTVPGGAATGCGCRFTAVAGQGWIVDAVAVDALALFALRLLGRRRRSADRPAG